MYLDNTILIALVAVRAHETARRFLLGAARRHDAAWAAQRRREFLRVLRTRANRGWKRGVCAAPTLLVTSDDFSAQSSVQEWRAMCPHLQTAAIPTTHRQIFEPAAMAAITPVFLAALGGKQPPGAEGAKDK
jgi:thioesterase domain-containing protein